MRRRCIQQRAACLLLGATAAPVLAQVPAQVVVYEGDSWPESSGWTRVVHCDPERALTHGWFEQSVSRCPAHDPPGGQQETFTQDLSEFVGSDTFFLEWRMETTGPASEIIGVAPASMVLGGDFGTNYHFTVARDQVRMIRDNFLPILHHPMADDVPHIFRLELWTDTLYTLYIDGGVIEKGIPEGAYPANTSAVVSFRAKSWFEPSTTAWDYIRYGVILEDGSGDYDSDEVVTDFDYYFVHDCLTKDGPGIFGGPDQNAGPGCRFADFDGNDSVDLLDFAEFQNLHSGPRP